MGRSRRYGGYDGRTAAEVAEDTRRRFAAILAVLRDAADDESSRRWNGALSPNEIADAIEHGHGIVVKHTFGHSGKRLGGGSSISPTLQAMQRKGWITWATRTDGLSGSAYRISPGGRAALAEIGAP